MLQYQTCNVVNAVNGKTPIERLVMGFASLHQKTVHSVHKFTALYNLLKRLDYIVVKAVNACERQFSAIFASASL
ncbi:hypothetical protein A0U89_07055 [Kozakia baliensis]|uniref:Uncharacterized protein n=1 Tax=Kozakia baliensis TaxID=153496 RepID=A0A1D8UTG1_9PROT|nr:hypothetical protein A0U89_07055 [Kozakia baliensis]